MNEFRKEKTFTKSTEESKSVFKCFKNKKERLNEERANITSNAFILFLMSPFLEQHHILLCVPFPYP